MGTIFLDMNEAAGMMRVSKSYLYKKVMTNSIPHHKIGRRTVFDQDDLIQYVRGNCGEDATKLPPKLPSIRI